MKLKVPGYKIVNLFFIAGFLLFLAGAEIYLRLTGVHPGFIYSNVEEVDSLIVKPFYYSDDSGVQRLAPFAADLTTAYLSGKKKFSLSNIKADELEDDLQNLIADFYLVKNNLSTNEISKLRKENGIDMTEEEVKDFDLKYNGSEFVQRIQKIYSSSPKDAFDSILLDYVGQPVNSEGFRSLPFGRTVPDKKKILLLGNSFTWGRSAIPLYTSFADILLARGYLVYNTGIVSTDPAQYVAVVNEYLDSLRPDLVIINFSINDKMPFLREPKAGEMEYHHTNAGLLSAWPLGYYMNAREAYDYAILSSKIPNNNWFNRLCTKTAITTKFWIYLNERGMVNNNVPALDAYYNRAVKDAPEPVSNQYIERVMQQCGRRKIPCIISVIPDLFHFYDHYPKLSAEEVFKDIPYVQISNLQRADYIGENGDDHLNNAGHKKYADFLQSVIDSVFRNDNLVK
jgi:hypothetical protein